jgi:hypothetical protein
MFYNNPDDWYLYVTIMGLDGPFKGTVFSIDEKDCFTFGRSPDCTASVPDDDTVSPLHFKIVVEPPVVWLKNCGNNSSVFLRHHHRMIWSHLRHSSAAPGETVSEYLNTALLRDKDYIRVCDYTFIIQIDMPSVCICCGGQLNSRYRAISKFVGDICYCMFCIYPDEDHLEGCDALEEYITAISPFIDSMKSREREMLMDNLLGQIARLVWLRGVFNNREFVEPDPDCGTILKEYKSVIRKIFGDEYYPFL